jgi:uncharacterized protein
MAESSQLVVEAARVPSEGLEIREDLSATELQLEAEEGFALERGSVQCRIDRGDDDALHVQGVLRADLRLECGRCLDPYRFDVSQRLDLYYLPQTGADEADEEIELKERDLVVGYYREGRLDLRDVVREQLLLAPPMKRLCREDCRGLCPTCSANRNRTTCSCPEAPDGDVRLAGLAELLGKTKG